MEKHNITPDAIYEHTRDQVKVLKEDFIQRFEHVKSSIDKINQRFTDWSSVQETRFDMLEEKIFGKIDKILESVNKRSEINVKLATQLDEFVHRLEKVEVAKEIYDKTITEISVKVDQLITMMTKYSLDKIVNDVNAAHEKLRDHEDRLRPLEKMAGKFALKLLWYFLTLILGSAAGFLISYLSNQ